MANAFTPPALSSHEGPASFVPPPLSSHEGAASDQQPSAFARFGSELLEGLGVAPAVRSAVKAVTHPMASLSDLKDAGLSLLRLAAEAETNPSAAAVHMGEGIVRPIAEDVAAGNMAGAAGRATGSLLLMAAPEAGEIAEGVGTAGRAVGAGVRAAAPDVAMGAAQIGAGELLGQIPGMEWPARIGMGYPGARQIATGLKAGFRAGRAATRAAEEIAPTEVPTGFGVASGSTAAPTRGVPMTPGVIPDVAGALPGAPVAASTPVAAAPVSASPAVSMPSAVDSLRAELEAAHAPPAAAPSVESLRVDLEASLRDGIARANGFKKGFESIPEHNPARQNIEATAAAIARAEQGTPEVAAVPVAAPPPGAAVAAAPPLAATEAPVSGAPTPPPTLEMPRFQVQPTPDEASISTPRSYASARSHPDVTAATAYETPLVSPVPRQPQFDTFHSPYNANGDYMSANARALQIEQWNVANKGMRLAQAMDKAGITLADAQKATPEQWQFIEKTLKQKGLIDSEQVIDGKVIPGETVPEEAIPSIINNLWKIQEAKRALGISGSEPTGIGGLMSRKPAATNFVISPEVKP